MADNLGPDYMRGEMGHLLKWDDFYNALIVMLYFLVNFQEKTVCSNFLQLDNIGNNIPLEEGSWLLCLLVILYANTNFNK